MDGRAVNKAEAASIPEGVAGEQHRAYLGLPPSMPDQQFAEHMEMLRRQQHLRILGLPITTTVEDYHKAVAEARRKQLN